MMLVLLLLLLESWIAAAGRAYRRKPKAAAIGADAARRKTQVSSG